MAAADVSAGAQASFAVDELPARAELHLPRQPAFAGDACAHGTELLDADDVELVEGHTAVSRDLDGGVEHHQLAVGQRVVAGQLVAERRPLQAHEVTAASV